MIDCAQLASQLITKVTLYDGTRVDFSMSYTNNQGNETIRIYVAKDLSSRIDSSFGKIGELRFDVIEDVIDKNNILYIIGMDNYSSDKHLKRKVFGVGSLLHEIAFRLSVARGLGGRVKLSVARNSGLFHKKSGFVSTDPRMNERLDAEIERRKDSLYRGKRFDDEWRGLGNGCSMFLPPEAIQKKQRAFFKPKDVLPENMTFFNAQSTVTFKSKRTAELVSQKKISAYTALYLEGNLLLPEYRDQSAWDAILSANGLWLIRSGYLPANYACIYFSQYNSEKLTYLVSDDALDLFSKNLIAWQDFVNLSIAHVKFILTLYGIKLLHTSHITIDKVKILPYELVRDLDESVPCYRKVYQALECNLITLEYLRDKYSEAKRSTRDFWQEVSDDIDKRSVEAYFQGARAKDNDNDKKFVLLSSPEVQDLIKRGIITWLDFVSVFPLMDIEKTCFALTIEVMNLLSSRVILIDEIKSLGSSLVKEFNDTNFPWKDRFYDALERRSITIADINAFHLSHWNSKQFWLDFEVFLNDSMHSPVAAASVI